MTRITWDLEADGLLDRLTRIHCVVMYCRESYARPVWRVYVSEAAIERAERWAAQRPDTKVLPLSRLVDVRQCVLVGHNTLGYDYEALRRVCGVDLEVDNQTLDTLVLSRFIRPDAANHGLAHWGQTLGHTKIAVDDWESQPLEVYLDRCRQDVRITDAVYERLMPLTGSSQEEAFQLAQTTYAAICKQERAGVPFDEGKACELRDRIEHEMQQLAAEVEPLLGELPAPKSQQPTLPKKVWKKPARKGAEPELTVVAKRYMQSTGINLAELERRVMGGTYPPVMRKIELGNVADVKRYLYTEAGWRPTMWRMKTILVDAKKQPRSPDCVKKLATRYATELQESPYRNDLVQLLGVSEQLSRDTHSLVRYVTQRGRSLPTTPQLQDPVSHTLCPNLGKLGDMGEKITRWLSLRNRRGVLQSWLDHPRLSVDGRLPAGVSGLTNTHRARHVTVVNVPKADPDVLLGREFRSLFRAPRGYVCIGADLSGLEQRLAGHFAAEYDDGEYLTAVLSGDVHAVNAAAYSRALGREVSRNAGKGPTYAILYGCGRQKLASMLDTDSAGAGRMIEAFWSANPGLAKLKNALSEEWRDNNGWYISTLDGRRVPTRSEHSLLNCLIQSSGAVLFDRWCALAAEHRPLGAWRWGVFHDEQQWIAPTHWLAVEEFAAHLVSTAKAAGEFYNLRCPIDAEAKTGSNWAEVH